VLTSSVSYGRRKRRMERLSVIMQAEVQCESLLSDHLGWS
jgi:hypothetical protein